MKKIIIFLIFLKKDNMIKDTDSKYRNLDITIN